MLIYISSYPRSGNSLMQNLISNFFERPISGVEPKSKLIKTEFTKNWRRKNWHYNDQLLPDDQSEIQSLASKLNRRIFRKYALDNWIVLYDLDVPPYTKNHRCLLPGCQNILTPKNRQKLAKEKSYFFIKTHNTPYEEYFGGEYVIQIIRHPKLVFESYFRFLKENGHKDKTMEEMISGKLLYGSWSKWHQNWEKVSSSLQDNFLRLHFEAVLSDTHGACNQIKTLINLNFNPDRKLTSFEELNKRYPNYYHSGKVDSKETSYTLDQLNLIQELHGFTMKQFGYE